MTDLQALADRVRHELDTYEIPEPHPEQLGAPLPASWFEENLACMRKGLVEPYWAQVLDYDPVIKGPSPRSVAIVARDDLGNYLAYDPKPSEDGFDNDFAMVGTEADGLHIYNIRGDAVGTFLSF